MAIYIRSTSCISPQKTFGESGLVKELVEYQTSRLNIVEPDYKAILDPKSIRRISHIVKMGVAAAKECLRSAGVTMPGAIVTGTAYGCMEASSAFLTRTITLNEDDLSPTAFMQSTHNTVGAQVALMLKCHQYNVNFVHKGFSFEHALRDAIMLLNEGEATTVLTGGIDEMTDISFIILSRLGLYKRHPVSNLMLFNTISKGSIGGEGAAFFLLSKEAANDNLAQLAGLEVFYKPDSASKVADRILQFLQRHSLTTADIDLIITGRNGDPKNDEVFVFLANSLFKGVALANYKHLCGDYPTSAAFALWLAAGIIKSGNVPDVVIEGGLKRTNPKLILIYNHYLTEYHSLMLVSAVD